MSKFKTGTSGNPAGSKRGYRGPQNKLEAMRRLFAPHTEQLAETVLACALQGDSAAAQTCLNLLATAQKARNTRKLAASA